jgi:xylan 1,4-beta-xylosidase
VWHYHDDDVAGAEAAVELSVEGLEAADGELSVYRVDETHSNAFTAWKSKGSPQDPTEEEYAELEKAGRLAEAEARAVNVVGGRATIEFALPRKGVALLVMEQRHLAPGQ